MSPPPPRLRPFFLMKRILFHGPRIILLPPPWSGKLENLLPPQPPTSRMCHQMGPLVKGDVDTPRPPTPHSCASSNPTTSDDTCPNVEVPEAYPKAAQGRLVNDQKFIDELN